MNKVNETEWKYQLDRAYFEIDVAMNKYRTEENIEARNAHLRTAMCRIGEVRGEIRNTHQEPTLKSSEGLVEVVELINSHINLRRLSGPMVHLNDFIDSLNAVRHAISTITPTTETASESEQIIERTFKIDTLLCSMWEKLHFIDTPLNRQMLKRVSAIQAENLFIRLAMQPPTQNNEEER